MEWDPNTPALWDWDDSAASAIAFSCPQEPPIGLKLGKRTYFEDVSAAASKNPASSSTSSSPSAAAAAAAGGASVKKARVAHQSAQIFRCQVEGCDLDLSASKEYHRKHRVCESHSKCPRVVVAGQERRFCQQCSRFHDLSAFDEKKRSCRKRLADHNARRRKPQQATISFSSQGLSSQFYGDREQMNLLFDRAPFGHMRPSSSSMWEASCDFKISHGDGSWRKSTKGDLEGHLLLPATDLLSNVSSLRCDLDKLLPFKVTTAEGLSQGPEASVIASNLNGAPNLRRALSLLSTDSWISAEPGPTALSQAAPTNQTSAAHAIRAVNAASHYWQDEQPIAQQARVIPFSMHNSGSHFQDFSCLKSHLKALSLIPVRFINYTSQTASRDLEA